MKYSFKNFEGIEYEVVLRKPRASKAIATCDHPETDNPKIYLNPNRTIEQLESDICHECLHAFLWELPEYKVIKLTGVLAKLFKSIKKQKKSKNL